MKDFGLLLACSLIIVATTLITQSLHSLERAKLERQHRQFLETLWKVESRRVQTLLNQVTAKDFPMFAGMQQVTQQNMESQPLQSPPQSGQPTWMTSSMEYIPRDDITEALRMQAFGTPGYGETIFEEDDNEAAALLSDLIGGGQNDMTGREDNE